MAGGEVLTVGHWCSGYTTVPGGTCLFFFPPTLAKHNTTMSKQSQIKYTTLEILSCILPYPVVVVHCKILKKANITLHKEKCSKGCLDIGFPKYKSFLIPLTEKNPGQEKALNPFRCFSTEQESLVHNPTILQRKHLCSK